MLTELDAKGWELYHVDEDSAETKNLAVEERNRLIAMIGMWYTEAGKYNVLPIDSRGVQRIARNARRSRSTAIAMCSTRIPRRSLRRPPQDPQPATFTAEVEIPGGRRGGRLAQHGRQRRRHLFLRAGRQALLCP